MVVPKESNVNNKELEKMLFCDSVEEDNDICDEHEHEQELCSSRHVVAYVQLRSRKSRLFVYNFEKITLLLYILEQLFVYIFGK